MKDFPVGYYDFHTNEAINFQLNRWYSSGCLSYDMLMTIGREITDFESWTDIFLTISEQAHKKGDYITSATCLRAAQFYTLGDKRDPTGQLFKVKLYERCMEEYNMAYLEAGLSYVRIPIENGYVPVLYRCHEKGGKGDIVIHGGYDSFMQELIPYFQYIYEQGFHVYMFEGFGQGEVLNRCGLKMRIDWEACTSPVLDYFGLQDVTIIGISLGGYLATRAAAYEKRIKRLVMFDLIYDFYGAILHRIPIPLRQGLQCLMRFPNCPLWRNVESMVGRNPFSNWLFHQGCYVYGNLSTFYDYLNCIKAYHTRTISAKILQDVLVLGGAEDLYTVYYKKQLKALCCAKSVTGRIFTKEESASHHCQIGNMKLALDYILDWICEKQMNGVRTP